MEGGGIRKSEEAWAELGLGSEGCIGRFLII